MWLFGRGVAASCHRDPGGHLAEPLGRAHCGDVGAKRLRRLRLRRGSCASCDVAMVPRLHAQRVGAGAEAEAGAVV